MTDLNPTYLDQFSMTYPTFHRYETHPLLFHPPSGLCVARDWGLHRGSMDGWTGLWGPKWLWQVCTPALLYILFGFHLSRYKLSLSPFYIPLPDKRLTESHFPESDNCLATQPYFLRFTAFLLRVVPNDRRRWPLVKWIRNRVRPEFIQMIFRHLYHLFLVKYQR